MIKVVAFYGAAILVSKRLGIFLDGIQLVLEKPSTQRHQDLFGQHSPGYFFQGRTAG